MFASKTTALLERTARAQAQGLRVSLLKPGLRHPSHHHS
jgi:thymidine kinase